MKESIANEQINPLRRKPVLIRVDIKFLNVTTNQSSGSFLVVPSHPPSGTDNQTFTSDGSGSGPIDDIYIYIFLS